MEPQRQPAHSPWELVRSHPIIASVLLVSILAGAVLGVEVLTPEWSFARRLLAGAISGAGVGLLITATKIF